MMKLLATFREKDVFPNLKTDESNMDYKDRLTGKAIVFNDKNEIALVGNRINNFYILPGGGIDKNEPIKDGIMRECLEEIGYKIDIIDEVGIVEDYRARDKKHCTNYCYTAKATGEKRKSNLTEDEKRNGLRLIWVTLNEAIEISSSEMEQLRSGKVFFYNTGFNILRDNLFLREIKK